jgi:magnesium chelatase family protein
MTLAEALDGARIHRVASLTSARAAVVSACPFRAPHHTISDAGIIGGGQVVVQDDVSLIHHGALCPDELPARTRHVLKGRSSEVVFRLRLLRRQDQIAEQPSH